MTMVSPDPQTPQEQMATIRASLAQIESMIANEHSLVGSRMSWFAISQSFLFGAYATIATDPQRLNYAFQVHASATNRPEVGQTTIAIFLLVLPLVGFFFAAAALMSVHAATTVLSYLDPARGQMLQRLNELLRAVGQVEIPVIGNHAQRKAFAAGQNRHDLARTILWGRAPQIVLPLLMMLMWLIALALRVMR